MKGHSQDAKLYSRCGPRGHDPTAFVVISSCSGLANVRTVRCLYWANHLIIHLPKQTLNSVRVTSSYVSHFIPSAYQIPGEHRTSKKWIEAWQHFPQDQYSSHTTVQILTLVQKLRPWAPNAGDWGSIPGRGTRSHMPQLKVRVLQLERKKRSWVPQLWPGIAKYIYIKSQLCPFTSWMTLGQSLTSPCLCFPCKMRMMIRSLWGLNYSIFVKHL